MHAKINNSNNGFSFAKDYPDSRSSLFPFFAKSALVIISILFAASFMATASHADDVTLAWDANSDPGVIGY